VLGNQMANYWAAFAKNGSPDYTSSSSSTMPHPAPHWPRYTTRAAKDGGDTVMRLQLKSEGGLQTQQHLRKDACDLQDTLFPHPTPTTI
jgi:hypothetical protein